MSYRGTHHADAFKVQLNSDVGRAIREQREAAGFTQVELAGMARTTGANLGRIEAGDIPCPIHILVGVAEAVDCSIDELVPVTVFDREEI